MHSVPARPAGPEEPAGALQTLSLSTAADHPPGGVGGLPWGRDSPRAPRPLPGRIGAIGTFHRGADTHKRTQDHEQH